jgi:hypothetical protein
MQTLQQQINVIEIEPVNYLADQTFNGVIINMAPFNLGSIENIKAAVICGRLGKLSNGQVVFDQLFQHTVDINPEVVSLWGTDDSIIEDYVLNVLNLRRAY